MFIKKCYNNDDGMPRNKFTQEECNNFIKRVKFIDESRGELEFIITEEISSLNDNWRRLHSTGSEDDIIVELKTLIRELKEGKIKFTNLE